VIALWSLLLAVVQAAAPSPAPTPVLPPVSVTAVASKAEVTVGEAFTIELKATGPAGATYTFPGEAETDGFELRTPPPDPKAGPVPAAEPGSHRYEAAVFALGEMEIPPIPVRYRLPDGAEGEASSEPVPLKVVSLLPKDPQEQKLADIRGPLSVGIGRAFWVGRPSPSASSPPCRMTPPQKSGRRRFETMKSRCRPTPRRSGLSPPWPHLASWHAASTAPSTSG
jgi:hypothetical protein